MNLEYENAVPKSSQQEEETSCDHMKTVVDLLANLPAQDPSYFLVQI